MPGPSLTGADRRPNTVTEGPVRHGATIVKIAPALISPPRPDERLREDQALAVEALTRSPPLTTIVEPVAAGTTSILRSLATSYRTARRVVCVLTLSATAAAS